MKRAFLFTATVLGLICWGCARNQGAKTALVPSTAKPSLPERIARELAAASPLADPGDARARDAAADKLVGCLEFRTATGPKVIWGGYDPARGHDPEKYLLTEFDPLVWLKVYASTIMFTGEHEVRKEGSFTVLAMKAKFRSKLDAGEYPYPFWHTHKKWRDYVDLDSVNVVFKGKKIIAAYRVAKADPANPVAERPFDGNWLWTDANGTQQPRVSLFGYMFGADNPYRAGVDEAYRKFEAKSRAQDCNSCHAPDNKGKSKALLIMVYPNQALVGRHALVQTLKENKMPPEDLEKNHPAGIADKAVRAELIQLAQTFAKEADAALAFESSRKTNVPQPKNK